MEPTPTDAHVAAELRGHLARQRLRQIDVSAGTGISQASLSRRLSGRGSFTIDELTRLAAFLEIDCDQLLPPKAVAS